MYENDDDSESDDENTENPFEKNENPSKILCFLLLKTVKKYMHWYNHVTKAITNKIIFCFNIGKKNTSEEVIFSNQCCIVFQWIHFGCSILVIEDNNSINETSTMKQLQDGIAVVIPCEEWPKKFLPHFPQND